MDFATGQSEGYRLAETLGADVDLSREAAVRATQRLTVDPHFRRWPSGCQPRVYERRPRWRGSRKRSHVACVYWKDSGMVVNLAVAAAQIITHLRSQRRQDWKIEVTGLGNTLNNADKSLRKFSLQLNL
ncbi:MAG: hypothetical protein ACLGJC_16435 [Alphaproteobacteria bacterium]